MKVSIKSFSCSRAVWLAGLLSLALVAATLRADGQALHFLADGKPNAVAILPPPPLPDSAEQAADMDEVRTVYHAASSNDIAAANSERKFSVFNFTEAIGAFFVESNLPRTAAFFEEVQQEAERVAGLGKDYFHRPRPYITDPSLANGKPEKTFSYPSAHSTEAMVLALVLAEAIPDRREAIVAKARLIGWHRVQIAKHYPTDIYAGRVLAQAIVWELDKSEVFEKELAEVKAEIAAARK